MSLGYFQKFADFEGFGPTQGLPVVRRATGGGAIVHHYDWTYSIAMPAAEVGAAAHGASTRLYDCVHQAVVDWLGTFGIKAQLWSKELANEASCLTSGCSFLCFERRHAGDVVVNSSKVMGSAQRRLAGAVLQHGSLLLSNSSFAPSLVGLTELAALKQGGLDSELTGYFEHLTKVISDEFSIRFRCCNWVEDSLPITESIKAVFDSRRWTARI